MENNLDKIDKLILDIIIELPILNMFGEFSSGEFSIRFADKDEFINIRKLIKNENIKITRINQLVDYYSESSYHDRTSNIIDFIIKFLDGIYCQKDSPYFDDHWNYIEACKLVTKHNKDIIHEWACAYRWMNRQLETWPKVNNIDDLRIYEVYVRYYYRHRIPYEYYNLYLSIHQNIPENLISLFIEMISGEKYQKILDSYQKYLKRKQTVVTKIKIDYVKRYCSYDKRDGYEYNIYYYGDSENLLEHLGGLQRFPVDEDDAKRLIACKNYTIPEECQFEIIEEKTPVPYVSIEIADNTCSIYDAPFHELLGEYSLPSNVDKELIYCDALRQLVREGVIDPNYEIRIVCK